jgi:hypothetical protein
MFCCRTSAPLQPLLPLPFLTSPACHFLRTSRIPSLALLPHLSLPPQIPICFPDCVVPTLAHLLPDPGFEHLPLGRLPIWRYLWKRNILYFPQSSKALQSDIFFTMYCTCCLSCPNLHHVNFLEQSIEFAGRYSQWRRLRSKSTLIIPERACILKTPFRVCSHNRS